MNQNKCVYSFLDENDKKESKECGIDVCVNTKNKDFGEAMVEAFGPDKADVIYDR